MATVRTRKRGKTYSYIFEAGKTADGKRKVIEKGGFETKADAYKAGTEAYTNFLHGNIGITSESVYLSNFLDLWIDKHAININHSTASLYRQNVRLIKGYIGNIRLQDLKPRDIDNMVIQMYQHGYAYGTIANKLSTLKNALNYAVYPAELINFNPVINITIPKKAPRHVVERKIVSFDTVNMLLAKDKSGYYQAPLMLAYHTGMRLREIYGLTWDNVDLTNHSIQVIQQINDLERKRYLCQPKTTSSVRTIYIDNLLADFLKKLKTSQAEQMKSSAGCWFHTYITNDGYLLQTTSIAEDMQEVHFVCLMPNGKLGNASSFGHFLSKFGLNAHSFRHTHATILAEANATPKEIAGRLGHSSTAITQDLYTHETEKMRHSVAEIFEKTISKNADKNRIADKMQTKKKP